MYGRYGRRQWAAALPWTRLVIKDPFALLSIPAIQDATRAKVVVVYRHPAAVLTSYRRMGWHADLDELRALLDATGQTTPRPIKDLRTNQSGTATAVAMAAFWESLYTLALDNLRNTHDVVVVSHEELSLGGAAAAKRLAQHLGLEANHGRMEHLMAPQASRQTDADRLHNLTRPSKKVAQLWKYLIPSDELAEIEDQTEGVRTRLHEMRIKLHEGNAA